MKAFQTPLPQLSYPLEPVYYAPALKPPFLFLNELLALIKWALRRVKDLTNEGDYHQILKDFVAELQPQGSCCLSAQQANPRQVVLIDGDGSIFHRDLIKAGLQGGKDAAAMLYKAIAGNKPGLHPTVLAYVFLNKEGLGATLKSSANIDPCTLDQFLIGFGQTSPLFICMDVGNEKEAADAKIKELLTLELSLSSTGCVYFAGCHDSGYLSSLRAAGVQYGKHRITLMKSYETAANGFEGLGMNSLSIDGLFEPQKLCVQRLGPRPALRPREYPDREQRNLPGQRSQLRSISARSKQPHCYLYHLSHCNHGKNCRNSHEPLFGEGLELLSKEAKKRPCTDLLDGNPCLRGEKCIYSHECPDRLNCSRWTKLNKTCWFKLTGMHGEETPEKSEEIKELYL